MASHMIPFRKQVAGQDFAVVQFTDRARGRYVQRCMIDGKPVTKQAFSERMAVAEQAAAVAEILVETGAPQ